jgi:hypothetical protein
MLRQEHGIRSRSSRGCVWVRCVRGCLKQVRQTECRALDSHRLVSESLLSVSPAAAASGVAIAFKPLPLVAVAAAVVVRLFDGGMLQCHPLCPSVCACYDCLAVVA